MDDILKLNVGGRIFLTTRGSLCAEGGSMLANKFDPASQFAHPIEFEGVIFIDRDPDSFKYILNYLRDGCRARFGVKGVDVKQLEADADYFGLVGLKTFCTEAHKAADKEERDMASTLRKIATSSKQIANKIESIAEKIEGIADSYNTEAICDAITNTNSNANSNTEAICEAITNNSNTEDICEAITNNSNTEAICEAITNNSNTEAICEAITNNSNTEAICEAIRSAESKIEDLADALKDHITTVEVNESVHGNLAEVLKDGLNEIKDSISNTNHTNTAEALTRSFRRERSWDSHRERDHHGREDSRQRRRRSEDPSF